MLLLPLPCSYITEITFYLQFLCIGVNIFSDILLCFYIWHICVWNLPPSWPEIFIYLSRNGDGDKKKAIIAEMQIRKRFGVQFLKFLDQTFSVPSNTMVLKIINGTEQNSFSFLDSRYHGNSQN